MKNNFKYSVRQALIEWALKPLKFDNDLVKLLQETKQKEWPQINDKYWFVCDDGDIEYALWDNDSIDLFRKKQGNVFKTEAEAKAKLKSLMKE